MNYASHISERVAKPQTERASEDQLQNNAGGYTFQLDPWLVLDRFLILGTQGGSYYASERKMTIEHAQGVRDLIRMDAARVVNRVVEISDAGRAPKNDPALFVLAMVAADSNPETRALVFDAIPKVARIGTHLLTFVDYVTKLRGWSRGLRRAVANWYASKDVSVLAQQLAKYQSRTQEGSKAWSQRDLLRLSHVKADGKRSLALRWAVGKASEDALAWADDSDLRYLYAHETAQRAQSETDIVRLVRDYGLVRESIPTQWLNSKAVWDALLDKMPLGAMTRNLGKMSMVGTIAPMSDGTKRVVDAFGNTDQLRKSRLHPLSILAAMKTYAQGHGMRGGNSWDVSQPIVDALDKAFYGAFQNVTPTGKRFMLAVDCSGSMSSPIAGLPITCRDAAAAMSLVIANTETNYHIVGFTSASTGRWYRFASQGTASEPIMPLAISPSMRLDSVANVMDRFPWGGTDCALPMIRAQQKRIPVDCFVVLTDNETWAGAIHPFQALREYRKATNIDARLVVVGMTATEFTIADPSDRGMLDVVGFDTATPDLISQFAAGKV